MSEEYPNKISEEELEHFTPAKLCGEEYTYKHSEDCHQAGCQGHIARIKYNSTSDMIHIDLGDGNEFYLDSTQTDILWDWFNRAKI